MSSPTKAPVEPGQVGPTAWLSNSLKVRAKEMRAMERRCRKAAYKGAMLAAALRLADCYAKAAACFDGSAKPGEWINGSPSEPGSYWIHWRTLQGEVRVEVADVSPALFSDTGRLLLKLGSGVCFQYEPNRELIMHYMPAIPPCPPTTEVTNV